MPAWLYRAWSYPLPISPRFRKWSKRKLQKYGGRQYVHFTETVASWAPEQVRYPVRFGGAGAGRSAPAPWSPKEFSYLSEYHGGY